MRREKSTSVRKDKPHRIDWHKQGLVYLVVFGFIISPLYLFLIVKGLDVPEKEVYKDLVNYFTTLYGSSMSYVFVSVIGVYFGMKMGGNDKGAQEENEEKGKRKCSN